MKNVWRMIPALLLAIALLSSSSLALPSQPEPVRVLISVDPERKAQIITTFNISPDHEFQFMPVISATIPSTIIPVLARHPAIDYVELDRKTTILQQSIPWGVDRVNAPPLHAQNITGSGVTVAVLDTGIDANHQDLNVAGGVSFVGGSWYDIHGHGTHVAGTIAALDNTIDVLGVAPAAELWAVKVLSDNGTGYLSDVAQGVEWCISNGIDIINMSLGSAVGCTTLMQACKNAWKAGIVLIAAAGNSGIPEGTGNTMRFPAIYDSVIAVGATDQDNNRTHFSSTGPALEIMAPGLDIRSTAAGGGVISANGTSMAAPHVAGIAALMLQANPGFSNHDIRSILHSTSVPIGNGDPHQYGMGLADAYAAVTGPNYSQSLSVTSWTDQCTYHLDDLVYIYAGVETETGLPVSGAASSPV